MSKNELQALEYEVLGTLYFIEPLKNILDEVNEKSNVVKDCLRTLVADQLVAPYTYDQSKNRFERTFMYDSDNLEEYYFGATQKGIDLHSNSRVNNE